MKRIIKLCMVICVVLLLITALSNIYITQTTQTRIYALSDVPVDDYQCIMVLGAGVLGDRPSPILQDRLDKGYQLYQNANAPKLLLSGDHYTKNYNEVNAMKKSMLSHGVPADDLFMDHAGLSTYESMMRAKRVFGVNKMIIVTQKFHINRALYLSECVGIDAIGVCAEDIDYAGASYRESREYLARVKAVFYGIFKPNTYIDGDLIDISGSGTVTDDKLEMN